MGNNNALDSFLARGALDAVQPLSDNLIFASEDSEPEDSYLIITAGTRRVWNKMINNFLHNLPENGYWVAATLQMKRSRERESEACNVHRTGGN